MENETLTWLHVSDLHIKEEDEFNRKVAMEALWQDIGNFIAKGIHLDFIAFTGDVSYNGLPKEYELAITEFFDPLLAVTKIGKDRLFIIPGNHDVNRNKTTLIISPIPAIGEENDIHKILQSPEHRDILLSPFSNYRNFIHSYLSPDQAILDPEFSYCREFVQGDFLISIVGLNSSWLSGYNLSKDGHVDDFGKLAIGEFQVREALPVGSHIKIVLMHHPTEWLIDADRNVVESILNQHSCTVLRGHLHRPDIIRISTLSGNTLVIPSGAVFDRRYSPNAYNIVQVDLKTGAGTVYLRRYNDRRNEWQKDIESTGEKADGQTNFKLPGFWWTSTIEAGERESSKNVRNYTLIFTNECRSDIASLNMTEDDVINLVQGEFRSHLNYFVFDLEDYPLPVRTNHIVYLSKIEQRIEFRRIVRCTKNEAQLASWNDILTLYRRATRLAYREDPAKLILLKGMVRRVDHLHLDLCSRLEKHYKEFYNIFVDPGLRNIHKILEQKKKSRDTRIELEDSVPASGQDLDSMGDEIAFHILQSSSACHEAYELVKSMDTGDIIENHAVTMMLVAFERSLQHIHKIILRYPPIVK